MTVPRMSTDLVSGVAEIGFVAIGVILAASILAVAAAALVDRRDRLTPRHAAWLWRLAISIGPASGLLFAACAIMVPPGAYPTGARGDIVVLSVTDVKPDVPSGAELVKLALLGGLVIVPVIMSMLGAIRHRKASPGFANRTPCTDARALRILGEVSERAGVPGKARLSELHGLPSPVATHREICLPTSMAPALDDEELRCVLAHELAHIVRRDPLWFSLARWGRSFALVQPLLCLARVRLERSTEHACDTMAVAWGADRLALARVLARFAEPGSTRALTAAFGGGMPSLLVSRVRSLTCSPENPTSASRRAAACLAMAAVVTLSAGLAACLAQAVRPVSPPERSGQLKLHSASGLALFKADGLAPSPRATHALHFARRDGRLFLAEGSAARVITRDTGFTLLDTQGQNMAEIFVWPEDELLLSARPWPLLNHGLTIRRNQSEEELPAWSITRVERDSVADRFGLHTRDVILTIDGQPIAYWDEMRSAFARSTVLPIRIVVEREGEPVEIHTQPTNPSSIPRARVHTQEAFDAEGRPIRALHDMAAAERVTMMLRLRGDDRDAGWTRTAIDALEARVRITERSLDMTPGSQEALGESGTRRDNLLTRLDQCRSSIEQRTAAIAF